jgi:hypothetical protein
MTAGESNCIQRQRQVEFIRIQWIDERSVDFHALLSIDCGSHGPIGAQTRDCIGFKANTDSFDMKYQYISVS